MGDARYDIERTASGLVARSPAQGFTATFDARGFALHHHDGWSARLETRAIECAGERIEATGGEPVVAIDETNRVSLPRTAGSAHIDEWLVNGSAGIEQGFTIPTDPCARRASEVRIRVAVDGLRPRIEGSAVALLDGTDVARASYGGLHAEDARGAPLVASLATAGDEIELRVGTEGARWPVVVDPLVATQEGTKALVALDPFDDYGFGWSIALDATTDTLVVGARDFTETRTNQGAVFVYASSTAGVPPYLQAVLRAQDPQSNGRLGDSVAISGNTILTGAYGVTPSPSTYVFVRAGTAWTPQAKLVAGSVVALDGDTALIGGMGAQVWVRSGTAWTKQATLTSPDGDGSFGTSVSISGNLAVVGSPGSIVNPGPSYTEGAAFVFARSGSSWSLQAELSAADGGKTDGFGSSVSINGTTAIVGSPGWMSGQGAAYIFTQTGSSWPLQTEYHGDCASCRLGKSVAVSGNTATAGQPGAPNNSVAGAGTLQVYTRTGTSWTPNSSTPPELVYYAEYSGDAVLPNDGLGSAVAISGTQIAAGMAYDTPHENAVLFTGGTYPYGNQNQYFRMGDELGTSVSVSRDTAILGAPYALRSGANMAQGAAYVFQRNTYNGGTLVEWDQQQEILASDATAFDSFGTAVAIDIDTVVVGAPGKTFGANSQQGASYVFARSGTAWTQQGELVASDPGSGDRFGTSVAVKGNTSIVGACSKTVAANLAQGAVYVFARTGNIWSQTQEITASDGQHFDSFGSAVALDGTTALIGAPGTLLGSGVGGSAYVFVLSGSTWIQQQRLDNPGTNTGIGKFVSLSGDTAAISDGGMTHVFVRDGTLWSFQATIAGGSAVVSQDTIVAGGQVFTRSGTAWTQQAQLTVPSVPPMYSGFPVFAGIDGHHVVIGVPGASAGATSTDGAGYAFVLTGIGGDSCGISNDCAVGYACVAGVCCTTVCNRPCEVCTAALGATADGTCTPVSAGTPGMPACTGNVLCDGTSGTCPAVCSADADCLSGFCAAGGTCNAQLAQGTACDLMKDCMVPSACAECATGHCVDGFCCDAACGGACQSCDGSETNGGVSGICDDVKAGLPDNACVKDTTNACGAPGYCDGSGMCQAHADASTSCGPQQCVGPTSYGVGHCDGNGACAPPMNGTACPAGYACEQATGACAGACNVDGDCADGYACSNHACKPTQTTCSTQNNHTQVNSNGTTSNCTPYACFGNQCPTNPSCAAHGNDDCATGYVCNRATNQCESATSSTSNPSGCGCALPGDPPGGAAIRFLLLGMCAIAARRRRARQNS
jgi:hypothetical protein